MLGVPEALAIFNSFTRVDYRVACSILCVKRVLVNNCKVRNDWHIWADDWFSGKNRQRKYARSIGAEIHAKYGLCSAVWASWAAYAASGPTPSNWEFDYKEACSCASRALLASTHESSALPIVLTTHFICPHCHKQPDQHTKEGKCFFSPYTWKGINDVWKI